MGEYIEFCMKNICLNIAGIFATLNGSEEVQRKTLKISDMWVYVSRY